MCIADLPSQQLQRRPPMIVWVRILFERTIRVKLTGMASERSASGMTIEATQNYEKDINTEHSGLTIVSAKFQEHFAEPRLNVTPDYSANCFASSK